LLDMTMPQMNGDEAFVEIRKHSEDAKVILISGYDPQKALNQLTQKGLAGFLRKPFELRKVEETLAKVINVSALFAC